jgi:hypothetical protein
MFFNKRSNKRNKAPARRRLTVEQLESRRQLAVDLQLLTDINAVPEPGGITPGEMVQIGNTTFFGANTRTYGREL